MGVGIETSSHIYGLFQETVVAVEIVLQDGSRVKCSKVSFDFTKMFISVTKVQFFDRKSAELRYYE
jgi:FAD/FMN-containing dehydrogenase